MQTLPEAADRALAADVRRLLQLLPAAQEAGSAMQLDSQPSESAHNASSSAGGTHSGTIQDSPTGSSADNVVCIISNDLGFDKLLRQCKEAGCKTVAISDAALNQYKHADLLLGWHTVQSGMF